MKITHVLWGLKYGGAETMLVDIVNQQCEENDVDILLINDAVDQSLLEQVDPRVSLRRINRPLGSRNPYYIVKLNRLILFSKADIIHFHQDDIIRYLPVYRWKKNLCLTVHSVETDADDVKKYNYVFVISEAVKKQVITLSHRTPFLIHNGIDTVRFNRVRKDSTEDTFRIVQIGRLDHLCKRQDLSLQALHQLVYKYHQTNIRLDIIGEGPSEAYLQELASQLKLDDYVSFPGSKSKDYIRENLTDYDLLVQPSAWEGFGLTVIEAMSACVPTLISNIDGMKTVSHNGEYSYVFESGNVDDMTEKLLRIMQALKETNRQLAEKAYKNVTQEFDISVVVAKYQEAYIEIIRSMR